VKYEESMSVLANQLFAISIQPAEVFDAPSMAAGSSLSLVVNCLLFICYIIIIYSTSIYSVLYIWALVI